MAVKYGPAKKNPGKQSGESIFAAARKERKEQAANRRRAEQDQRAAKSASWQARLDILSKPLTIIQNNDPKLSAYMDAYDMGRRVINCTVRGNYTYFAPVNADNLPK